MAEDNSLVPSVMFIFQHTFCIAYDSTIPGIATSKVKRNCSYTCQQSQHVHESLGTRLQCLLPLISLHFLLLIGFYFSKVHDDSTALTNICCASVIFSIQTHPFMANEYIIYDVFFSQVYIYLSIVCIHTASLVPFPP